MNIVSVTEHSPLHLVEIIDFKWLMAGDGHRVHVERLQADPDDAGRCPAMGAASQTPALRDATQRLAAALNLPPPSACDAG